MKITARSWLVALLLIVGVMAVLLTVRRRQQPSTTQGVTPAPVAVVPGAPLTVTSEPSGAANRYRALRDDPRPAVRKFAEFAAVANLYDLDPQIVGYIAQTNQHGRVSVVFDTPTHTVSVKSDRMDLVRHGTASTVAHMDRNHMAIRQWYQCTGTWSEEAALKETIAILERLGDAEALAQIQGGKHEVVAPRSTVRDPNGNQVQVTPFYRVRLKNEKGRDVIRAEYRMGSNGPAGLVDWWNWP
jgi:hypothetical protein